MKSRVSDGWVILYALYKYSERTGERQFTMCSLLEAQCGSVQIFGLSGEETERIFNGLSANYPEFLA